MILGSAAAAPDHGQITPWRFVIVPEDPRAAGWLTFSRRRCVARDAQATPEQVAQAREKAYRAHPC
jgi:nitroreductase